MQNLSNCTILVVDDIKTNIDILVRTLGKEYRIQAAMDGESALKSVEKAPPDLILLDIMMTGMDGYEVCRRLKSQEETRYIPVIFLTGLNNAECEAKGLRLGAVDFITKPFSRDLVKARVHNHLALKLHQDRLEDIVKERTTALQSTLDKLTNASLDTIFRLSKAAEYKDENTCFHIKRVSDFAAAVGARLGLSRDFVENLRYAAPMHDIGKIGIPDRILLKPGKLDAEEWDIMKQHTVIGGKILQGADNDFLKMGEKIALSHHEKWDGSGYPNGLEKDEIPMEGRIVAVVDVFDALTSKRPYKDPFPTEKSFEIIEEGRGGHFDPDVVDAFFDIRNEILDIKARYRNEEAMSMPCNAAAVKQHR
ncbi:MULTISPECIES: HD-GYP domain-containing protein [Desulfococcus]|uniref:Response regulator receiver modulated metal dependent phosphohydrolase n=1 Tax=Desulfococcus multivorans DSM 2059 TaxID=1121405 RepID=S7UMI9_DESML|nr:two-component system response regulator [Desulfococcus multivorans]AOY58787.1 response regulator receiver modulated metal dependent phosphohydrolase [Desulfococcus multivorans]AQV01071.1 two-component system response regulator [Desulfococcus multivorans]EPR35169.1 response regulator receiver modulated metal dependent phosphohydrolase [Desulfococcus multivorans DSM 2059]SJZ50247.1 response regulator receiver modulated metal dependent phosphohydrolase [Desulfococcus multivorans DSM 2059]